MTAISAPYFHDDDKAREYLEAIRWPNGPVCPNCQTAGGWAIESKATSKNKVRPGLYKCVSKECGKQFSVTVRTVFERSKIPLSKWLMATFLLCSSKKGMSAHQLHRTIGVTYKTAWFLAHRIRHAMTTDGGLIGQNGGIVEADETYIGRRPGVKKGRNGFSHKNTVLALVQRDGEVRSTVVTNFAQVKRAFKKHASPDSNLMTDEHKKVPEHRQAVREPRGREPQQIRVHAGQRVYEHHRGSVLDFQARHERGLPALRQPAPAPVSHGV